MSSTLALCHWSLVTSVSSETKYAEPAGAKFAVSGMAPLPVPELPPELPQPATATAANANANRTRNLRMLVTPRSVGAP